MFGKPTKTVIVVAAAVAAVALFGAGAYALTTTSGPSANWTPAAAPGKEQTGQSSPAAPAAQSVPQPKPSSAAPAPKPPAPPAPKPPAGCPQGTHQRQVEESLAKIGTFGQVTVDGVQSAEDCAAIKKFQKRYDIWGAPGQAGPTTAAVAKRLAAVDTGKCDARSGLTVCVDLTNQVAWAIRDGSTVWGPTPIRSGMSGFATPAGRFKIGGKANKIWSHPYKVWLPAWQQFNGDMGFHTTTTNLYDPFGSHGCLNLLEGDSWSLFRLTPEGTPVHIFGHRAGT